MTMKGYTDRDDFGDHLDERGNLLAIAEYAEGKGLRSVGDALRELARMGHCADIVYRVSDGRPKVRRK